MSTGQDKAISVVPTRIVWIVFEIVSPDLISHRSQSHRGTRVPAIGGLNPIHAQGSDGVDGQISQGAR